MMPFEILYVFSFELIGKEESLEDLQRTFVKMFGGDLAKMMDEGNPTVKKRARDSGSNIRAAPKRNTTSYRC